MPNMNKESSNNISLRIVNKLRAEFRAEQQARVSKFVHELMQTNELFEKRLDRVISRAFREKHRRQDS